jgi:hypothetical protein
MMSSVVAKAHLRNRTEAKVLEFLLDVENLKSQSTTTGNTEFHRGNTQINSERTAQLPCRTPFFRRIIRSASVPLCECRCQHLSNKPATLACNFSIRSENWLYGKVASLLKIPLDSPSLCSGPTFLNEGNLSSEATDCHEIENNVIFHVAVIGYLGCGPESTKQHITVGVDPTGERPDRRFPIIGTRYRAPNSKYNTADAGNFSGHSGRLRANHPGNCSRAKCRAEHNRSQRDKSQQSQCDNSQRDPTRRERRWHHWLPFWISDFRKLYAD